MSSKQKTGQKLKNAGKQLFWKYGFKKVSVEEICSRAGVSKMTFYRYFENKTELAKKIMDCAVGEGIQKFREIISGEDSVDKKMETLIRLKMEGTHDISPEFIQDVYLDSGSGLHQYITQMSTRIWSGMIDDLRQAQENGFFRKDFKPQMLVAISFKMVELMNDPRLTSLYGNTGEMVVEMTRLLAYGMAERENNEKTGSD